MKKLFLVLMFCSALLFVGNSAFAIPTLGVAPGAPGEPGLASASYDGFPMPLSGGELTIWYGNNSGKPLDGYDIYLLTTSSNGADFSFNSMGFTEQPDYPDASYKAPVYGVNLGDGSSWDKLEQTFYSYEFEGKNFHYLTGTLDTDSGAEPGSWMYSAYIHHSNPQVISSPPTTSAMATPEPATLFLLGSGLVGLAGFGRKKFKK